jgi:crotonobetainyl-CoA:carnitine CoA-transferase CaiB-like acyl-CoA transferase
VLANQGLNYLVSGSSPPRLGNAHPNIVPYQTFATKDGHIIITVGTDRQFREFCRIAALGALADDARFSSNHKRVENRTSLVSLIAKAMTARTTQEWVDALEAAAIPCGPINSIAQVFADRQVLHRGMRVELARSDGVKTPAIANPVRLAKTPVGYDRAAPLLGADTDEVLHSLLELDKDKIAALRRSGVVE